MSQTQTSAYSSELLTLAEKITILESEFESLLSQSGAKRNDTITRLSEYIQAQLEDSYPKKMWDWYEYLLGAQARLLRYAPSEEKIHPTTVTSFTNLSSSSFVRHTPKEENKATPSTALRANTASCNRANISKGTSRIPLSSQTLTSTASIEPTGLAHTLRPTSDPNMFARTKRNDIPVQRPSFFADVFSVSSSSLDGNVSKTRTLQGEPLPTYELDQPQPRFAISTSRQPYVSDSKSGTQNISPTSTFVNSKENKSSIDSSPFLTSPLPHPWITNNEPNWGSIADCTSPDILSDLWGYTFGEIHWKNIEESRILQELGPLCTQNQMRQLTEKVLFHETSFPTEFFLDPSDEWPPRIQDWFPDSSSNKNNRICKPGTAQALHFWVGEKPETYKRYGHRELQFRLLDHARICNTSYHERYHPNYFSEISSWLPRLRKWSPTHLMMLENTQTFYISLGVMLIECCRQQVPPCDILSSGNCSPFDRFKYVVSPSKKILSSGAFMYNFLRRHHIDGLYFSKENFNVPFMCVVLDPHKHTMFLQSSEHSERLTMGLLYFTLLRLYMFGPNVKVVGSIGSFHRDIKPLFPSSEHPKILDVFWSFGVLNIEPSYIQRFRTDRLPQSIRDQVEGFFREGKLTFLQCTEKEFLDFLSRSDLSIANTTNKESFG